MVLLLNKNSGLIKVKRRYTDLHGQRQNLLNADGILLTSNTRAKSTSKTRGLINLKKEKLKIRRVERNTMREQHAVHKGFEAGMTAETLEIQGKRLSRFQVTCLLTLAR